MMRKIRTVSIILCLLCIISLPFVAETNAKYVVSGSGNAAQVHFVKTGFYGSDTYIIDKPGESEPLWGVENNGGSTNPDDYTLDTLSNVEIKLVNDTDELMKLTFIITVEVTGGNPFNNSTKTFTIEDTTTGETYEGSANDRTSLGNNIYEIRITDDTDFFIVQPKSAMHTYRINGAWSNQSNKGFYASLSVIADTITTP